LAARKHSVSVPVDRQNKKEGEKMNGVHTTINLAKAEIEKALLNKTYTSTNKKTNAVFKLHHLKTSRH
jgi:division protein CdvB (Snf7/Vps24/ESCRT-III family)